MNESWFAVAAAVMLVASLAGAAVAATNGPADADGVDAWSPDVPDVHDVAEPEAAGTATIDGDEQFDSIQAAVDAADPGETVLLEGRFDERVTIETPDVTIAAAERDAAVIDGGGEGTVLEIAADDVALEGVWIRNGGHDKNDDDSGILVDGANATLSELRLTEVAFGIWVHGVDNTTVEESLIAGREDVSADQRGNGIHLWEATDAELRDNHITTVRDGIYYQWSSGVVAENNVMWELRYGVHYMYSDDNRLANNTAFDNDVGFALMVSEGLTLRDNVAVNNDGPSGHGILVKDVERSEIVGNEVVGNDNGLYVYNAQDNRLADNLVLENAVGVHITAGSTGEVVTGNSFIGNGQAAYAHANAQTSWNDSDQGNYWADASGVDLDGDGTSEIRHQPAGSVEKLVHENPQAAVFAESPAFDAVRLAESSFPVVESPGVVDHRPLAEPPHKDWRSYYDNEHHDN
ncbi:nitrous oxide reductase family maturation protein NosD [Natronorubrum sp. JWXQ-INN-674]|uniref:Nitrous oxide reductase family maturation protein NosD n=1 Tax=Natronorubrum halalkaliphilum TaxID=2691917 RepID=A0A6B0VQA5_9EURY|nr:nitrous oxide reductase family maturation protein NosD [Natronorubrum halalkaliphilum]MXV63206.1 nitrous oxide reductase family maturation protein NosD [Natronorubrum halalkaliphilum]